MSTQYNKIQRPYDELRKTTIALVERVNVREIVLPLVRDAKVLDLACGTGFFTRSFLNWGAQSVVGVDISSAMLEEARARNIDADGRITYIEADCSTPTIYPEGPFDIAFGAWLLNYAPTHEVMVEYYRNITANLKGGGHFVAVTPPPTNEPVAHYERECRVRPLPTASGGLFTTVTGHVTDGVMIHLHSDTPAGDLDFDCYHLHKDVWEAAARDAGFTKSIVWRMTNVPSDFMDNPAKYDETADGGAGKDELATYAQVPHFGLLILQK